MSLFFFSSRASGTNIAAIDNKIEQAMVSHFADIISQSGTASFFF